ncbi:hypothetical protein EMPG_09547, partial [Blastomyces silverae]
DVYKREATTQDVRQYHDQEYSLISEIKARLKALNKIHEKAVKSIQHTQEQQAEYYNQKHLQRKFAIENQVLLSAKNIKIIRSCKKLSEC